MRYYGPAQVVGSVEALQTGTPMCMRPEPVIPDSQKIYLARSGPNRLFGLDRDAPGALDDGQLIALFDRVWEERLRRAYMESQPIDSRNVHALLKGHQRNYVDDKQQHFQVRVDDVLLIAQVSAGGDITQFWHVRFGDTHPKTLFLEFDTREEFERFKTIAQHLGYADDRELGLELVRDFMAKFDRRISPTPAREPRTTDVF